MQQVLQGLNSDSGTDFVSVYSYALMIHTSVFLNLRKTLETFGSSNRAAEEGWTKNAANKVSLHLHQG